MRQRQFAHRVDWGWPSSGVMELVDADTVATVGLGSAAGGSCEAAKNTSSRARAAVFEAASTTFEREYTLCFWFCPQRCPAPGAGAITRLLGRGDQNIGACPALSYNAETACLAASVNVDPGPGDHTACAHHTPAVVLSSVQYIPTCGL